MIIVVLSIGCCCNYCHRHYYERQECKSKPDAKCCSNPSKTARVHHSKQSKSSQDHAAQKVKNNPQSAQDGYDGGASRFNKITGEKVQQWISKAEKLGISVVSDIHRGTTDVHGPRSQSITNNPPLRLRE